jgi:multicomponent Na+:H+ antiporter subunit F
MFQAFLIISLILLTIAMLGLFYRLIKGPTVPDRVVALDALGVSLIGIIALTSMLLDTSAFLEVILLLSILSFIGTVAFSIFLQKGDVINDDRDY